MFQGCVWMAYGVCFRGVLVWRLAYVSGVCWMANVSGVCWMSHGVSLFYVLIQTSVVCDRSKLTATNKSIDGTSPGCTDESKVSLWLTIAGLRSYRYVHTAVLIYICTNRFVSCDSAWCRCTLSWMRPWQWVRWGVPLALLWVEDRGQEKCQRLMW